MPWEHHGRTCLHEAALTPVFEDGQRSIGTTIVDGVSYELLGDPADTDAESQRPSAAIVGWVLECDCRRGGGHGSPSTRWESRRKWSRVPSASLEVVERGRVFAGDDDVACAGDRDDVKEAAQDIWMREHIEPLDVDDEIRAAINARREAEDRLDAAVSKARQVGLSWAKIGEAAGMTAQSAHERWKARS